MATTSLSKVLNDRTIINLYRKAVIATINKDIKTRNDAFTDIWDSVRDILDGYAASGSIAKGVGGIHQVTLSHLKAKSTDQVLASSKAEASFGVDSHVNGISGYHNNCQDSNHAIREAMSILFEEACDRASEGRAIHFKGALDHEVVDKSFVMFLRKIAIHRYKWSKFANKRDKKNGNIAPAHLGTNDVIQKNQSEPSSQIEWSDEELKIKKILKKYLSKLPETWVEGWVVWTLGNRVGKRSKDIKTEQMDYWTPMGVGHTKGAEIIKAIKVQLAELFSNYTSYQDLLIVTTVMIKVATEYQSN